MGRVAKVLRPCAAHGNYPASMAGVLLTAGAASVAGWVTPNGRLYWSGHGFVQLRHGQLQTGEYLTTIQGAGAFHNADLRR